MSKGFSLFDILKGKSSVNTTGTNAVAAGLSFAASLFESTTPTSVYELYKQQEQAVIDTAISNASKIRAKGEVELRNLDYTHRIQRGADVTKVAAAGGNLSGSFLDVLVQKAKFQMIDEATVKTNTEMTALETLREGYMNAATYAMNANLRAEGDKRAIALSLVRGVQTYLKGAFADKQASKQQDSADQILQNKRDIALDSLIRNYGLGYPDDQELTDVYKDQVKTLMDHDSTIQKLPKGILGDFSSPLQTNINQSTQGDISWA